MPVLDGYAATAEIRRLEGDGAAHADHRHDRARDGGRPRALPRRGDGRLPEQAAARGRRSTRCSSAGSPRPRPTVMDRTVLHALARDVGDEAIVEEICDLFLAETGPRLIAMRAAAREGDAETLRVSAHTLKGSAANVGAVAVAGAAAELERARAGRRARGCRGAADAAGRCRGVDPGRTGKDGTHEDPGRRGRRRVTSRARGRARAHGARLRRHRGRRSGLGAASKAATRYDVLITDWMMPGLAGPDLCRKVRELTATSAT